MELLAFFLTNRGSQDGTYRASFAHRCRRFLSARAPDFSLRIQGDVDVFSDLISLTQRTNK